MSFVDEIIEKKGLGNVHISQLLKKQLLYCFQNDILHIDRVLDEIYNEEFYPSRSKTKRSTPFKGNILKDFWHVHFTLTGFIEKNIGIEMDKPQFMKKLEGEVKNHLNNNDDWLVANLLTNYLLDETYYKRADYSELTGEWIIFKKFNEVNYYLTLALHNENNNRILSDTIIFERIKNNCMNEYPMLFPQYP